MKHWFKQFFIGIDQLLNAILGGWADETLSSRAWRTEQKGRLLGCFFRPVIDTLAAALFNDLDHCKVAFESERKSNQLPPEFRESQT